MTSAATGTFATARSRLPVDDRKIQCINECQLAAGRSVRNHGSWWFCLDAPPHPNPVSTALYPGQIALKGSLPACNRRYKCLSKPAYTEDMSSSPLPASSERRP
jgi:hypothetical protein